MRDSISHNKKSLVVQTCYTIYMPVRMHGTAVTETAKTIDKKEDMP